MLEIYRVRCRRCGVRTERVAFVECKAHATTRLAAATNCWRSTAGWPRPTCSRSRWPRLWDYRYAGAALRLLLAWLDALRWQRLPVFQRVARLLLRHLDGILAYCHEKVPFDLVEEINGNIRLLHRGRGYRDHEYLLLKVQKATTERRRVLRAA